MKVLTIQQPWATLIAIGAKTIETRSWTTNYRGKLAIHSSKAFPLENQSLLIEEPFKSIFDSEFPKNTALRCGYILATCELVNVVPIFWKIDDKKTNPIGITISDKERALGNYQYGRFAWILENVKVLETPIPAKGMLGLWEYEAHQ
jgi:hypothetical protein